MNKFPIDMTLYDRLFVELTFSDTNPSCIGGFIFQHRNIQNANIYSVYVSFCNIESLSLIDDHIVINYNLQNINEKKRHLYEKSIQFPNVGFATEYVHNELSKKFEEYKLKPVNRPKKKLERIAIDE